MTRLTILVLLAAAAQAQAATPAKRPPASVDRALRERVAKFYTAYVSGQFRDAEPLVAPDTKNFFYAAAKPQYLSFAISGVTYSDNFTRAAVLTLCKEMMMFPGFTNGPVPIPVTSYWKLVKGKWYWWVDQTAPEDTPFGKMGGTASGKESAAAAPPLPPVIPTSPDFALHKVTADRASLALKTGGSGEVTFSNSAQGPMSVSVNGNPAGFEITPAHADLAAGAKAIFTVKALPDASSSLVIFRIGPTGETIELKVAVD